MSSRSSGTRRISVFAHPANRVGFSLAGLRQTAPLCPDLMFRRERRVLAQPMPVGESGLPAKPISDVIDFVYTGNRLHPTQKPVAALSPLIESFCPEGGLVLDPFCGSGSTLVAARDLGRDYLGTELSAAHHLTATERLGGSGRTAP